MIKIGLIGYGCVAQGFHQLLQQADLNAEVVKVCVKSEEKERNLEKNLLTTSLEEFFNHVNYDLVIELISDDKVALDIAIRCEKLGIPLISANKKMIAENLATIDNLTIPFFFEGAVAGSIPIIQNLENYYHGQEITEVQAVINGSCNYILTEMVRSKLSYENALEKAQSLGFAEADPWLDISGTDAAHKLAILAYLIFGHSAIVDDIEKESLESLDREELLDAHFYGNKVKQIASIRKEEGELKLSVLLQEITPDHQLYFVDDEYNAINLNIKGVGNQLLYGKGAGSLPTGLAVINDLKLYLSEVRRETLRIERLSA
jgi:homoserine dehydrogenase